MTNVARKTNNRNQETQFPYMNTFSPIRTCAAVVSAGTLLLTTTPLITPTAEAVSPTNTLANAVASMDANLSSLSQQANELTGQAAEVSGTISRLQAERAALEPVLAAKRALLNETIRESYLAGQPSSLEVLVSNKTVAGAVSQQQYRDEVSNKSKKASEELAATRKQLNDKIAEAEQKQAGLLALQGQLQEKIDTAQAQVAAKAELDRITQGKEAEYQKIVTAAQQEDAAALVGSPAPTASARPSAAPGNGGNNVTYNRGNRANNPYPYGQCTWYVYDQTGRGQSGNAGSWRPTSSTPAVGKIMIWRAGEQGAGSAGHVGIVIGVSGNSVTVRHMNWGGGPGVVTTGTFSSTGKFF